MFFYLSAEIQTWALTVCNILYYFLPDSLLHMCQTDPVKGHVAAGFHSNQARTHLILDKSGVDKSGVFPPYPSITPWIYALYWGARTGYTDKMYRRGGYHYDFTKERKKRRKNTYISQYQLRYWQVAN